MIVVFDLDDTLYLERDYVKSGFAAVGRLVREEYCVPGFGDYCWKRWQEGYRDEVFQDAIQSHFLNMETTVEQLVDCYHNHTPDIKLCPDVPDVLDWIQKELIGTALITDGRQATQALKTKALDLCLGCTVFTGDIFRSLGIDCSKPEHHGFRAVEGWAGSSEGSGYVYIADNPAKDFIAPHERGWKTIRIRREGGLHQSVPSPNYLDAEWTNLEPLTSWLEERG